MGEKLLVPIAGVVLAVAAIVAVWFMMQGDSPRPTPTKANEAANEDAPEDKGPLQLNPADFDVSRILPDPVSKARPPQPFSLAANGLRMVISGRVTNESGVGIADAQVTFNGEQKLRELHGVGYTDAGGNYTLLAWASNGGGTGGGDRIARVACETSDAQIAVSEALTLDEGDAATLPDLVVKLGGTIEGQVLSADGVGAAGAKITVRSAGPVEVATLRGRAPNLARRQFSSTYYADETGRYTINHLPPARYSLQVDGGYYGYTSRAGEADLTAAASQWVEILLDNKGVLKGVLLDQAGKPISGGVVQVNATTDSGKATTSEATVTNVDAEISNFRDASRDNVRRFEDRTNLKPVSGQRVVTDAAGRFGFGPLADIEYEIVSKLGEAEARLPGARVGQPDYTVQLDVATSVSGTVRNAETGLPVESFDVRIMGGGNEAVTPFDRVSPDARFDYHPGGQYLAANPPLTGAVARISAAGFAPAFVKLGDLSPGDTRRDLDVSLKPLCNLNFDLVRDGKKLDLEPVAMLFDDRLAYEASSNEFGRVRIPDVSPAAYTVKVVLADGTQLEGNLVVPAKREATLELKLK